MLVSEYLEKNIHAFCTNGMEFVCSHKSIKEAWELCPRGDWLIWVLYHLGVSLTFSFHAVYQYFIARCEFEMKSITPHDILKDIHKDILKSINDFGDWSSRMARNNMPKLSEYQIIETTEDRNRWIRDNFSIHDNIFLNTILFRYILAYYSMHQVDNRSLQVSFIWAESAFNDIFNSKLSHWYMGSEFMPYSESTSIGADAIRSVVPWSVIEFTIACKSA